MHTTATTTTSTPAIDLFLDAVRGDHDGPSAWAEERSSMPSCPAGGSRGGDEGIRRQLRAWFQDPVRSRSCAARQVHVLELDPAGRIAHDNMWCGGRWSAALLAEMEAASDAD